jgi:hypothetical protein
MVLVLVVVQPMLTALMAYFKHMQATVGSGMPDRTLKPDTCNVCDVAWVFVFQSDV